MTNDERLESIINQAKFLFEKDGYLHPMSILIDKDNNGMMLPGTDFDSDIAKDMFSFVIKKICKEKNIMELFLVTESWVKQFNTKENPEEELEEFKNSGKRVSDYEDKKEVIMILHETRLTSDLYFIPIVRFGNNVKLGEVEKMQGVTNGGGRFCGFLYSDDIENIKH